MQNDPSQALSQASQIRQFDFFVDEYHDDQIQEIISIFRNDFKPPKNLWIEKTVENSFYNGADYYADIFAGAIEQFNQQQLILQQKQQQELQDQVSSASSSDNASPSLSPDKDGLPGSRNNLITGGGKPGRMEFSPPTATENTDPDSLNGELSPQPKEAKFEQHIPQQIQQNAQAAQEKILQNLGSERAEEVAPQPESREAFQNEETGKQISGIMKIENYESSDTHSPTSAEKKVSAENSLERESPRQGKQFNPATDLNIFEQFNFDEMNINMEDINQNN